MIRMEPLKINQVLIETDVEFVNYSDSENLEIDIVQY